MNKQPNGLVETHYFNNKKYCISDSDAFYKILGHLYCIYWSIIVQQCNFYEIMKKMGHDEYECYEPTFEDIEKSLRFHSKNLDSRTCHLIYEQHIKTILKDKKQVMKDFYTTLENCNYKKITYIQQKLKYDFVKYTNIEWYDDKTYMPIYYYHSGTKNKKYYSIITYDGSSALYFDEVYKEQLARYYKADHKGCNKFVLDLLKPYFPMNGYTVNGDKVNLKKLCDNIRQYAHTHKNLIALTDAEITYFKFDLKQYINTCSKIWGNQEPAKKWIEKYLDDEGQFKKELERGGVLEQTGNNNKKIGTTSSKQDIGTYIMSLVSSKDDILSSCDELVEDNKIKDINKNILYNNNYITSLSQKEIQQLKSGELNIPWCRLSDELLESIRNEGRSDDPDFFKKLAAGEL